MPPRHPRTVLAAAFLLAAPLAAGLASRVIASPPPAAAPGEPEAPVELAPGVHLLRGA